MEKQTKKNAGFIDLTSKKETEEPKEEETADVEAVSGDSEETTEEPKETMSETLGGFEMKPATVEDVLGNSKIAGELGI